MTYSNLVIVADDNVDLADTTCALLQFYGINAHPCFSGADAILLARRSRPEVVVLDIGMPPPDGFSTFAIIRELKGCSTIPIIAVTAYSDLEHSSRIRETGFAAHLVKPIRADLLAATITRLARLEASRALDAGGRQDVLAAQRIEVALVYLEMLGYYDAKKYLESVGMQPILIERILTSPQHRTL